MALKLVSWNLNGRVRRAQAQADALTARRPAVIALQEVTSATLPILQSAFRAHGYAHFAHSVRSLGTGPRRYGVAIASIYPLAQLEPIKVPWPEKALAADIERGESRLRVYSAHIPPGSSNGWIKIETLEGLYAALAHASDVPRILCGDFNTPQAETRTGDVITWGQDIDKHGKPSIWGTFKGGTGERWDAAERSILTGLAAFDLSDVFRDIRGYQCREFSWYLNRKRRVIGRRFDHVFASTALRPIRCEYIHEFRTSGLSDHAAVEAEFAA